VPGLPTIEPRSRAADAKYSSPKLESAVAAAAMSTVHLHVREDSWASTDRSQSPLGFPFLRAFFSTA
jgi:hypothetical protein